ncbi:hypothetical protein MID07_02260 [Acinetobacter seifertii]|uniref:hypothetical protein n=1 Tax=Acinetobacter seifertii TaxID=1530123 RepID=UPI001EFFD776|nr:hypothetical protein [Acinetobacter seifertii]MCG8283448.1 hypothetical protein [Acinetobacter seifertii]
MKNFIFDCINGDALIDDLDDYIDYWTEHGEQLGCSLREYLGMSLKEYGYFLEDEDYLADIIYAHEHQLDIDDVIREAENSLPMAARAETAGETKKIQQWLDDIEDK